MIAFATGGLLGDVFLHLVPHSFFGEGAEGHHRAVVVEEKRNIVIGSVIPKSDNHELIMQWSYLCWFRSILRSRQDDEGIELTSWRRGSFTFTFTLALALSCNYRQNHQHRDDRHLKPQIS
jgi:hypothetical protein